MTDEQANAEKRKLESIVSTVLDLDPQKTEDDAVEVASFILKSEKTPRVFVCGASGSNKTTFAESLSRALGIPSFDLDEYIKGGFIEDRQRYERRLLVAWGNVWADMPSNRSGWVLEHVEMCHPEPVSLFKPSFAVLLTPPTRQLAQVAAARDAVGENTRGWRWRRSQETAITSKRQFDALPAKVIINRPGWTLKEF